MPCHACVPCCAVHARGAVPRRAVPHAVPRAMKSMQTNQGTALVGRHLAWAEACAVLPVEFQL